MEAATVVVKIGVVITLLTSQTSKSKLRGSFFALKNLKFTLEAIVQVARSLGTKSLEKNRIFSLRGSSVAFTNTDL